MNEVINIENLTKTYFSSDKPIKRLLSLYSKRIAESRPKKKVLENITLSISKGDCVGIVGCNGAGKSTLLKIISGVLCSTNGNVLVRGKVVPLLELGAGLNPLLTGRENIEYLAGISNESVNIDSVIKFSGLGRNINDPVGTYSSGMKARLGFAISINSSPDILIIDEVLAVGDALFKRKCFNAIEEEKRKGTTILFVSHSEKMVTELCGRAILLHNKKLVLDGTPKEVFNRYHSIIFNSSTEGIENVINSNVASFYDISVKNTRLEEKTKFYDNEKILISFCIRHNIEHSASIGIKVTSKTGTVIQQKVSSSSIKEKNTSEKIEVVLQNNLMTGEYYITLLVVGREKEHSAAHIDCKKFEVVNLSGECFGIYNLIENMKVSNELV